MKGPGGHTGGLFLPVDGPGSPPPRRERSAGRHADGGACAPGKRTAYVDLLARGAPALLRHCLVALSALGDVLRCQQVCMSWHHMALRDKWLKHCVLSGNISAKERRRLWWRCANVPTVARRRRALLEGECDVGKAPRPGAGLGFSEMFGLLSSRELTAGKLSEIERDVDRTFPTHPKFFGDAGSSSRDDLLRVLRATAAAAPDVGYCQGMNFVAATLLIHLGSASDAFWVLLAMIECCHFRHVFAPGVPLLPLRVFQFSGVVRQRLPKLWRHLKDESFSLDIFAQQCVLTLFAYSIEPELLAHVYDVFFFLGWKAVFRVGIGLLASLEHRLLEMAVEDISRFMHQSRRHLVSGASLQSVLQGLLRFKVSEASLEALQKSFQLERWEALLRRASSTGASQPDWEPLPMGLERLACGGFVLNASAFKTRNDPPWRRPAAPESGEDLDAAADAEVAGSSGGFRGSGSIAQRGAVVVPAEDLRQPKAALDAFDAETQRDVALLRERVMEAEKELASILRSSEALRISAREVEAEREEWQTYKRAAMDSLQAAVQTSPSSLPKGVEGAAPDGRRGTQVVPDFCVAQCLEKVQGVESVMYERGRQWRATLRELEPVAEGIRELQDLKARSMAQLSGFIEARAAARRTLLEDGLYGVLPKARFEPLPPRPSGVEGAPAARA